jgi:hypothetical protein
MVIDPEPEKLRAKVRRFRVPVRFWKVPVEAESVPVPPVIVPEAAPLPVRNAALRVMVPLRVPV